MRGYFLVIEQFLWPVPSAVENVVFLNFQYLVDILEVFLDEFDSSENGFGFKLFNEQIDINFVGSEFGAGLSNTSLIV